jgi:hypothetical protein
MPFVDAVAGDAALDLDYPDHRTTVCKPLLEPALDGLDAREA